MKTRKPYAPPRVAAEDILEQTSLACNATDEPVIPNGTTNHANGGYLTFADGIGCVTDVGKDPAFVAGVCDVVVIWPGEVQVLS